MFYFMTNGRKLQGEGEGVFFLIIADIGNNFL